VYALVISKRSMGEYKESQWGTGYVKAAWYIDKSIWLKPNSYKNMNEYVPEEI
jgi:hypothetical protein